MNLIDLIPDAMVLCALEPDELGLRMLPTLASWRQHYPTRFSLSVVLDAWIGIQYPGKGEFRGGASHIHIERAVREAWAWLVGAGLILATSEYQENNGIVVLSRRAEKLAKADDTVKAFGARRIPKEALHPIIREDVWALYHRGKYDQAVPVAMKAVEVAVRTAAGLAARDLGIGLMRKAFDPETGPLTDMSVEKAERQARSDMFSGAIGCYKNPHSHRYVDLEDPDEAAEIIMIANHLLRIVEVRRAKEGDAS